MEVVIVHDHAVPNYYPVQCITSIVVGFYNAQASAPYPAL